MTLLSEESIEQGFRWMRESISLMYAHHKHPLPMTALIFMYCETLGKGLLYSESNKNPHTNKKVSEFISKYMPKLWNAIGDRPDREEILGDNYRNGLAHQLFMKNGAGIHEDKSGDMEYFSLDFRPYSINIDRLLPDFLDGITKYQSDLHSNPDFRKRFNDAMTAKNKEPRK